MCKNVTKIFGKMNRVFCAFLAALILFTALPIKPMKASAATQYRYTYQTFTYEEIDVMVDQVQGALDKYNNFTSNWFVDLIMLPYIVKKIGVAGLATDAVLYFVRSVIATDINKNLTFLRSVKDTMRNNNYGSVVIQYKQEARVNRMYGDYTTTWVVVDRKAYAYYR